MQSVAPLSQVSVYSKIRDTVETCMFAAENRVIELQQNRVQDMKTGFQNRGTPVTNPMTILAHVPAPGIVMLMFDAGIDVIDELPTRQLEEARERKARISRCHHPKPTSAREAQLGVAVTLRIPDCMDWDWVGKPPTQIGISLEPCRSLVPSNPNHL
jgi:hypothetical protein